MSSSAKADVCIELDPVASDTLILEANKAIYDFISQANAGKLSDVFYGDYNIVCDLDPTSIKFSIIMEVKSSRASNLEWQLNRIKDFVYSIKAVIRMNSTIWLETPGISFDKFS